MTILPLRAKNPPERFPSVTITLIALNVLVYLLTTRYFLVVTETAIERLAFRLDDLTHNPLKIVSAMFLHGSIDHLLGNLLFLWIFGPSAEGRLGHGRYLGLYLLAGVLGTLIQVFAFGLFHPETYNLGASGAVMGALGMSLYMFPHARVNVFVWVGYSMKVHEWKFRWMIVLTLFVNIGQTLLQNLVIHNNLPIARGGVAYMCHIIGMAVGYCAAMLLDARRDSDDDSRVQKLKMENKAGYDGLSMAELSLLMTQNPDDGKAAMAYARLCQIEGGRRSLAELMRNHGAALASQGDPEELATMIFSLTEHDGTAPPDFILRVAKRLDRLDASGNALHAEQLYRRALTSRPDPNIQEDALLRLAQLLERVRDDDPAARLEAASIHTAIAERFPDNQAGIIARAALKRLPAPVYVFDIDDAKPATPPPPAPRHFTVDRHFRDAA